VVLGLELRAYVLSHSTSPFCVRYFRLICLGWLWTVILLISASWVASVWATGAQLALGIFKMGSHELFAQVGPKLLSWSLLRESLDYRCESPVPSLNDIFYTVKNKKI
jgi:hypothetical protein